MALQASKGLTANVYVGMRYRQVPFHWRSNSSGETLTFLQIIKSFQTNCESPNYISFWLQTYLTCIFNFIWHIKRDRIAKLVVLPLYPQFSISTTGSSLHVLQNIFRCYICINFLLSFCSTLKVLPKTSLDVSELSEKMHIYHGCQLPLYSPGINEKVISSPWLTWLVKSYKDLLSLKKWVQLLNYFYA